MYYTNKNQRQINEFVDVAIPKPRLIYERYGKRFGQDVGRDTSVSVNLCASSVIEQMTYAEQRLTPLAEIPFIPPKTE